MPYPISVCMIAKNEEKHIEKCLLAEMGQLIKVEAANLASLPFT